MRFHIGFSKRIKASTLLKLFGFLFVGLLAFLGLIQHGYAWTVIEDPTLDHWGQTYFNNAHLNQESITTIDYTSAYYYKTNNIYYPVCSSGANSIGYNCWNSNNNIQYNQFYSAYSGSSANYFKHITSSFYIDLANDNYCSANNSTDVKSIDFKFSLRFSTSGSTFSTSALNHFNQSTVDDLFNVYMIAHDSTNNLDFSTTCTTVSTYHDNNNANYDVTCSNVFRGNSTYNISSYNITILNKIPFNDLYNSSGSDSIWSYFGLSVYPSSSSCTDNCKLEYDCNDAFPIVNGEFPYTDDPTGLNDIYNSIKDDYNTNIPGINTDLFLLDYPENIQELLSLPLYLVNNIVENSTTCSIYEIDFSSIVKKWGDPNDSYVLRLPCMRSKIKSILGNDFYTLVDTILAAIVFYNVALSIIQLLNLVTSGVDLYSYYYSREHKKDGFHVNHATGEVVN